MRKEATLPIAERTQNVSFAGISIDPGEDIALPEAARRAKSERRPAAEDFEQPRPLEEDYARPFAGQASRERRIQRRL